MPRFGSLVRILTVSCQLSPPDPFLLLDSPGQVLSQGTELLKPVLGEEATKLPGKVMEGAGGILENGLKTGTGILKQVLPVFPGK